MPYGYGLGLGSTPTGVEMFLKVGAMNVFIKNVSGNNVIYNFFFIKYVNILL